MIEIHPKAIEYFNTQANELLLLLKPYKIDNINKPKSSSSRFAEYSQELPKDNILHRSFNGFIDGFGNNLSKYFSYKDLSVGLDGNDYILFQEFLEKIYHKKEINNILSRKYLEKCSFEWFEKKYKGEIGIDYTFVQYLFDKSQTVIKERKISIPISYLSIECSFKLGNLTYEFFDENYFNELFKKLNESKETKIDKLDYDKLRKDYQGVVFASKTLVSEKDRAIEQTIDEVDKQLKLIRCFSHSTFLPEVESYFNRKGHTLIPHNNSFIFEGGHPIVHQFLDKNVDYYFPFSMKLLDDYKTLGFIKLFDVINKEELTDMEDHLINVAFLFSQAIESKNFQDKLVYCLVALETLLLKDTSEPIQNTVGLRLSFLTKKNVKDRKEIIELIKKAYKLRSSYIHHGKKTENFEILRLVQRLVWQSIISITNSLDKFRTQDELLTHIEELILS